MRWWQKMKWNKFVEYCRVASVVLLIIIIAILIINIREVKFLTLDVCKICMQKTGCSCFCFEGT